jgi:DNA mismatch repair protein MutL
MAFPYNTPMPIAVLNPLLVNQIAAGEVIERPASVVKELLENCLDAGAKRIAIDIEDGGRELIRIADDGHGIPTDELPLAIAPHATSKISQPTDLESIASMGFRGEALASIASISRLRITSRVSAEEAGAAIEAAGDEQTAPKPVGCAPGTIIEVRNLFFNTPARRKFMRGASTEFGHISEIVQRIAMAHPDVGFTLRHGDRKTLDLPPDQPTDRRVIAIIGNEMAEALLEFESNERGVGLWGMAGLPEIARATTRHQYVYVNGRPVRDKHIIHAVKEAYRGLIEPTKQPTMVLFITVDPTLVDVNVHPAKAEVRFADSNAVHGQVLAVVRQRLLGADLTPAARLPTADFQLPIENTDPSVGNVEAFVNYFKQMDPKQKGFVYEQMREELGADDPPASSPREEELTDNIRAAARSILQVHNSYIVTQDEAGLVIIDQHALHERMMFQLLLDRIESTGNLESQRLLTPATFDVTGKQTDTLETLAELFAKIGIEVDTIGPNAGAVYAFPSLLFDRGVEPVAFVNELLDRAEESSFNPSTEAALHEVLDMMSCKAAVKAGDALAEEELTELLRRKDEIERASNCPHGRPTTVRLPLKELEKHFHRS